MLYDEEVAASFKDNDSVMLDPMMNPDEEQIDPVTMYRFSENTRRLDRLKAELNHKSISPSLPAIRNFDRELLATIDPS